MKQIKVPDYQPSDRQVKFHRSTAFETLYGGSAGGGKTAALVAEAITYALENAGSRVYIFRKTLPEIEQSIDPEIHKQCQPYIDAGGMRFNGKKNEWRFSNGSTIRYSYLQNPGDKYKYQSAEIHLLIFDELTHFTQDEYEYVRGRVRGVNHFRKKVIAATNPGGVGHGWVKNLFIDPAPPETIIEETIDDQTYTRLFVPAKVDDHPDPQFRRDYIKVLSAITDQALKKALRDGEWGVFAGQVFTEWRYDKHVVEPFVIPEHWQRWMGYDHGYNTHAAALWFARDPTEDRLYIYRELYVSRMGVQDLAAHIKMLEQGENITLRFADPAIWKGAGNQNTGDTVAAMFQKEGINFQPANNDRLAGKQVWHDNLAPHKDGKPKLLTFSSCVDLIRTLPSLPYDRTRVEDVDTRSDDHLYDAGRYGLIANNKPNVREPYKPRAMLSRKYGSR